MEHCKNCEYKTLSPNHPLCSRCKWRHEKLNEIEDYFNPRQLKVLTAEQAAEKYDSAYDRSMRSIEKSFFTIGYNYGRKYWRLERDQELRPALKLAREVKNLYWLRNRYLSGSDGYNEWFKLLESRLQELDDELNNIKPLEENGK